MGGRGGAGGEDARGGGGCATATPGSRYVTLLALTYVFLDRQGWGSQGPGCSLLSRP